MSRRRPVHLVLAIAGVLACALLVLLAGGIELKAPMLRIVERIRDAGPLPFFAAMAVLPAIGFPLSVFFAMAGAVFGPTMGVGAVVACAVAAVAINVALAYWAAAQGLRPLAERVLRSFGYAVPAIAPGAAWAALFVLRVVPVTPFFFQSLVLGFARVPFGPYMVVSTVVAAAQVAAVVILGDAIVRGDRWAIFAGLALILAVGTVLHFVRVRLRVSAAPVPESARDLQRN